MFEDHARQDPDFLASKARKDKYNEESAKNDDIRKIKTNLTTGINLNDSTEEVPYVSDEKQRKNSDLGVEQFFQELVANNLDRKPPVSSLIIEE